MGRRLLRALLCLLLLAGRGLLRDGGASATVTAAHGCLFDRRLCSPQEVCVQDGLFGQCQVGSVQDRPYFQVTSPVLQRLQDVLRHLMAQGLSWQDGITQYVISQEMERIPRLHPPPSLELAARDRFLSLRGSPRRPPLPADPSLPVAQHLEQPPPLLPSPLVQRYLEHLLLPSPPQLGYEEALLNPYSYHKFGYQDGTHQLPGSSARRSPETSSLLGRVPAQALFGAGPVSSYGRQPGTDGGHLFQDLGMLSLPREKASHPDPASTRLQHSLRLPSDYMDMEEREQPAPLAAQPPPAQTDAALKRLASLLASYGLGLPELSTQQLSSLSTLLQLLQSSGVAGPEVPTAKRVGLQQGGAGGGAAPQVTEGDMQHGEEPVPPSSTVPPLKVPASSSPEDRLRGRAASSPAPWAEPQQGHSGNALSPGKSITVEKKSYTEAKDSGAQQGMRPPVEYGYIVTDQNVVGPALTFRIRQNPQNLSLADVASQAERVKAELEAELGLKIMQTGVGERNEAAAYSRPSRFGEGFHSVLLTFITLACVAGIAIAASAAFCLRRHAKQREKERLAALGPEGAADTTFEYQELCRQHMASKSLFGRAEAPAAPAETSRVSSVSSQFSDAPQPSPSSHSSTPSWCEEPVQSNMDISTGHMILAYMEDHLRNRDRLAKEWQALCAYQAEPSVCSIAQSEANLKKNRNPDYVPYDHVRIKLKAESNPSRSDFINASPIIEHDPRMPAYIATQGPLSHTIADFWQMVWEHGCTVIVMLSPLAEDSVKQCDRYWPDEGSSLYHIYEVNLVSEHIWCEDFLVRSFYLKNVQSQETRTLTQFHFLSWPAEGIPTTTRPLLDFRRKVNKCYRGRSCPIIVHCSDGAGRTGTYILVDMVLNRMAKGVKEIDIAATLEHIRDQRPGMVQTKDQFEFALTAVAEEVNAILKALPQ
ncbi:receptor-type tyrosine-protein phosphatase-like N isoform X2 [Falco rusticolus]|uniref:receptor-type tyrosine-protein phosphatase-like N isoform X2 n=1 Tax=Falco rusticolus TaxID=120794 RepID=UPI001886A50E|nr:receptor-type tyrosine-protein phosphatase-like N isoform X2 [Falco rusticolus]XP_055575377.1 receptor-type tyrosine-protein phosphatase-like N isoform X2 [Falco cherrug]